MNWTIRFHAEDVERFVLELPTGLLGRYLRLADLMLIYGPDLGMPHTRAMGGGLFELRVMGKEGLARMLYCTAADRQIIFLHGFIKKSDKTPIRHLAKARERLKEVRPQ